MTRFRPACALRLAILAVIGCASAVAAAQLTVQDAWVRQPAPGQIAAGAFMTLQANDDVTLIGVSTPVAARAELHVMRMEGDVMRMRAVPGLRLIQGQTVQLKPGGWHIMLLDLKQRLAEGTVAPLTLRIELADRRVVEQTIAAKVRGLTAGAPPAMHHGHGGASQP